MAVSSLYGGHDEEHNGASLMEISDICATKRRLFDGIVIFDRLYGLFVLLSPRYASHIPSPASTSVNC